MTADGEISLRPLSLRPGAGVNPFAGFAMGAGLGLKNKVSIVGSTDEKKKPRGEVVKYPRDFLMKFAEVYTRLPTDLQFSNLEIVLDPSDPQRDVQRALLQRVAADEADERDWRSRAPAPSPAGAPPAGAPAAAAARESAPQDPNAPRIQRATDIGRTAWAAGVAEAEGTAQTLRKVKGILNKVTPEKFERLLSQLIPMIASYDVLQGTIRQVFENAVAQPTFVPMYADLCAELDAALPEFEGPDGPQFFKKMLANTCQEEYESTDAARSAAAQLTGESREDAERKAKQRLLGNVRLIAELFKKGMVNDRIMLLILSDLLGPSDGEPSEDALEAACEVLTVAGAALEENSRSKAKLEAAFVHLARLTGSKSYSSRVRFVVKDVIDLRSQHWVNRRESFTARKLEDIRTEAAAELGIVDVAIPGLEPLMPGVDSLPGMGGMNGGKRGDDMELFPALRGQNLSSAPGAPGGDGKFSAFLGEFVPESVPQSNATPPEAPGQAPRAPRTDLSPEDRESLGKSLFSDFISSRNVNEAVAAAQELLVPGYGRILVTIGIEKAFDALNAEEQNAITRLIIDLAAGGTLAAGDVRSAIDDMVPELEDLALDVPTAPRVLGLVLGGCAEKGVFGLDVMAAQVGTVEGAEPRRALVAAALLAIKESAGAERMAELVKAGEVDVQKLLQHDAGFEGHLPDASEFAKEQGIAEVM